MLSKQERQIYYSIRMLTVHSLEYSRAKRLYSQGHHSYRTGHKEAPRHLAKSADGGDSGGSAITMVDPNRSPALIYSSRAPSFLFPPAKARAERSRARDSNAETFSRESFRRKPFERFRLSLNPVSFNPGF